MKKLLVVLGIILLAIGGVFLAIKPVVSSYVTLDNAIMLVMLLSGISFLIKGFRKSKMLEVMPIGVVLLCFGIGMFLQNFSIKLDLGIDTNVLYILLFSCAMGILLMSIFSSKKSVHITEFAVLLVFSVVGFLQSSVEMTENMALAIVLLMTGIVVLITGLLKRN